MGTRQLTIKHKKQIFSEFESPVTRELKPRPQALQSHTLTTAPPRQTIIFN